MIDVIQIVLYILALINLVTIAVLIYFGKRSWALGLAILQIVIVYLSLIS